MSFLQILRNKQIWMSTPLKLQSQIKPLQTGLRALSHKKEYGSSPKSLPKEAQILKNPMLLGNFCFQFSPVHKNFVDLFTNNKHKEMFVPTIKINQLKVYEDLESLKYIIDPFINKVKIIEAPLPSLPKKKEAVTMLRIRRHKMKKHKLRKLRKRMKFVFAKIKLKRELRKEQAFRTELLTQVEAAEKFDAKAYVENVLNTIRYQPKVETDAERIERYRLLKKINKYETTFVRPNFDD